MLVRGWREVEMDSDCLIGKIFLWGDVNIPEQIVVIFYNIVNVLKAMDCIL